MSRTHVLGLLAFALLIVGFGLAGATPKLGASSDAVTSYVTRSNAQTWTGVYLEVLGKVLFIVLAARLWAVLRHAEGDAAWLSTTALAAALTGVVVILAADFTSSSAAFYAGRRGLDPAIVGALYDVQQFADLFFGAVNVVFFATVAVLVLRRNALPTWLGWMAGVVAAALVVTVPFGPGDSMEVPHFLAFLWLVAVSVLMIARRNTLSGTATGSSV